ncbi:hypothetical protein LTR86_008896 [Recurvomyces mirabilis]|nr:hypothetical protein LTR86_008896 [Recurvomyces mirabilis]
MAVQQIPREFGNEEWAFQKRLCLVAEDLTLRYCWFAHVPARLGHDPTFDSAADALGHAQQVFRDSTHATARHAAIKSYGRTLELIRSDFADSKRRRSDWTVIAIAMLGHYEILMRNDWKAHRLHWSGVTNLLLDRPGAETTSEIVRALLHCMWDETFRVPCAKGVPSPYESDRWQTLEPSFRQVLPGAVSRLRKLGLQLLTCLPRLIALVRQETIADPGDQSCLTSEVADKLNHLQDSEAETDVLHSVKITKSNELLDSTVTSVVFHYRSGHDVTAAVLYWQGRLMLVNLALRLVTNGVDGMSCLDRSSLETEQSRIIKNIIMSWSYAAEQGDFGTMAFIHALIAIWAALEDSTPCSNALADSRRIWTMTRLHQILRREPGASAASQLSSIGNQLMGGAIVDWEPLMGPGWSSPG